MSYHKKVKIILLILIIVLLALAFLFFRYSDLGTSILWQVSREGQWLLPLVAVSALIDSINPCAFSILLLTVAFLFSLGRLRSNILTLGAFYILGLFVVYLLIGLGILEALHIFDIPHFMARVGASLLIGLGVVNLLNHFFPSFPIRLRIPESAHHQMAKFMEKASLPAIFALGGLVGLCEFPCTGGPYLMVLGLLHDQQTYLLGLGYLVFYNLIFVLPLVIILLLASQPALLEKVQSWQRQEAKPMRLWGGLAMIVLGSLILAL